MPHDIYLKTLYTLVQDRLEGRPNTEAAELLWEAEMPELAGFQRVAVRQAIKILDTYGGDFEAEVRAREAEIRHIVGSALGRDYALSELRLVFDAEKDPEEKARLALLSEIFTTVPLTARAHRELNNLRRSNVTGQALIAQLLRFVRDYNLEKVHRAIADRAEEAPLSPRIVCSEALL